MSNFVFGFLTLMVLCFCYIYVWTVFYQCKIKYKTITFYGVLFLITLLSLVNYSFTNVFFRMILVVILFSICNYFLFKKRINEVIVSTIYAQAILTLSDVIVSLFLMIILKINYNNIREGFIVTYCGNLLVALVFILICRISIIKKFYLKLVSLTDRFTIKHLFFVCLLIMISINFIMVSTFYNVGSIPVIIINSILIFIYTFIVYRSISEKNNSLLVKAENDYLMDSLHQYEDMVDRQRVDNHENKNQLLVIKNMIKKNDKGVVKYIDSVIKNQKEDDEVLYTRVKTIPSGGLQGIIYQKMLVMKDKNILFSLDVSRDVRKIELDMLNSDDNYNLCRIMGVLLDNAIEGSSTCDDKRIMISLYVDDDMLVIEVSNNYDGELDDDLLDSEGFTTKGNGHGYGLCLVKDIVSNSRIFVNDRKISNGVFHQIIKVVIKNT